MLSNAGQSSNPQDPSSQRSYKQWFKEHGWTVRATEGKTIARRTWKFPDHQTINIFLPQLAGLIAEVNHHPDIHFDAKRRTLTLTLSTHAAGNILSENDRYFAQRLSDFT